MPDWPYTRPAKAGELRRCWSPAAAPSWWPGPGPEDWRWKRRSSGGARSGSAPSVEPDHRIIRLGPEIRLEVTHVGVPEAPLGRVKLVDAPRLVDNRKAAEQFLTALGLVPYRSSGKTPAHLLSERCRRRYRYLAGCPTFPRVRRPNRTRHPQSRRRPKPRLDQRHLRQRRPHHRAPEAKTYQHPRVIVC